MPGLALPPAGPLAVAARTTWLLEQEARALLTRLDRVKPFVLQVPMLPAAELMPSAQEGIDRHLMNGRRELRGQVRAYLDWLAGPGRSAPAPAQQRRFSVLKLRFNAALAQLDLFAEAIVQRCEHETGVWLAGLDVAAMDALALPGRFFEAPPLVCYLHRGMGGAIRRARTRLPGGGASPAAIIRIPRERMIGYGVASSLVHEVGHQGAALLGLVESLRPALQELRAERPAAERIAWTLWERWISEIVADLWALGKIGIASTLGLIGIVSLPPPFVFRIGMNDPHPFPWIRVRLSCAIGEALYPHPQWRQLAATWDALYPPARVRGAAAAILEALLATMPAFASSLLAHRPPALRGHALRCALRIPGRDPDALLRLHRRWQERPGLMLAAPPTLAFATFGRARVAGALTPEEESRLLGKLITRWALHSTLDLLGTCAQRWSPGAPRLN